jgi:hypothetical protein
LQQTTHPRAIPRNIDPVMGQSGGRAPIPLRPPALPGNGNLYSWECKRRCCSVASNLTPVGRGDLLAGRFREKRPARGPIMEMSTHWWVILSGAQPSSPGPRPKLPQSHPPPLGMCRCHQIMPVPATEIIIRRAAVAYVDAIGCLPLTCAFR